MRFDVQRLTTYLCSDRKQVKRAIRVLNHAQKALLAAGFQFIWSERTLLAANEGHLLELTSLSDLSREDLAGAICASAQARYADMYMVSLKRYAFGSALDQLERRQFGCCVWHVAAQRVLGW